LRPPLHVAEDSTLKDSDAQSKVSVALERCDTAPVSVLSDFFVATPEEAPQDESLVLTKDTLLGNFECVSANGLTGLDIGLLWAALEGQEWDADRHELEPVEGEAVSDASLERFPDTLVLALRTLPDERVPAVAQRWGEAEELASSGDVLRFMVLSLRRLAILAMKEQKSLYLWNSP
jgi:hypothetical protein